MILTRYVTFLGLLLFLAALVYYLFYVYPAAQDFSLQMKMVGPMAMFGGAQVMEEIQKARNTITMMQILCFGGMGIGGLMLGMGAWKLRHQRNWWL